MKAAIIETVVRTADTTTVNIPLVQNFSNCWAIVASVRSTLVSGTTPSMTVILQRTLDGTNWDNVLAFTAQTATNANQRMQGAVTDGSPMTQTSNQMRLNVTISGTTPSFDWVFTLIGKS